MKIRLIIASLFTFAIALVLAVTMRTSAVAQQESSPPPEDERLDESIDAESPDAEFSDEEPVVVDFTLLEESVADDADLLSGLDPAREPDADDAIVSEGEPEADLPAETESLTFDFDSFEAEDTTARLHESTETLSVDFPDEEIRSILRIVADLFDLNLVIPEALVGRASIKLRDVTWRQVFDVVLSPVGFTYIEDGNIIKVVSLESLTHEPPLTIVKILDYAQADGVLSTIQPLVNPTAGGRIQVDRRSNALVITERPTQLRRIERIVADLDKPNVQVMIESKFIETRNLDSLNIGVNWASLNGWGASAGPFQHEFLRERNVDSNETTFGFDADTSRITSAVFSADQFGVILSAMRANDDVKLVSNPTIVTLNNRPARIHIGEEFPIVEARFNQQTGTYEAGDFRTVDIGIKLDVTPQVNNAGFINLEVEPDVSTLTGTVTYFGAQYPIRSTRNTKSEVTIKDGYTLAIGGLTQDDIVNVEDRVPVLGSIPGLGRLFRSNQKSSDQRNLIIFLTARTLSPDGSTVEETVDPRMIHRMGITRDELPGYRSDIPMWLDEPVADEPVEEAEAEGILLETDLETDAEAGAEPDADLEAEDEVEVQLLEIAPVESEETPAEEPADSSEEGDASSAEADTESAPAGDGESPEQGDEQEASTEAEATEPAETETEEEPSARRSRGWLTPGS